MTYWHFREELSRQDRLRRSIYEVLRDELSQYLVEYGLQDAGITPTAQDLIDISNGVVPSSLRADAVHFTADGYTILAQQVYNKLEQLGWL